MVGPRSKKIYAVLVLAGGFLLFSGIAPAEWGFFGHRRINRMAVFTLPPEMMPFFRRHIEYLTDHAVDPDKRRYATKHEAVRHYIDIDHWGEYPFSDLPRDWTTALAKYGEWQLVQATGDTLFLQPDEWVRTEDGRRDEVVFAPREGFPGLRLPLARYRQFWSDHIIPQYYEEEWVLPCDSVRALLQLSPNDCVEARMVDHFSEYGIAPYHLEVMQHRLTRAFGSGDVDAILRLCAEMGHYIGDAHVPLHTTENYNGQLTNQVGIHAFWESRIPELFADAEYDFFVGKAEYIRDRKEYFWDAVLASHQLVDSVLNVEKRLSEEFPQDQQYCYEDRNGITIRTQCRAYARAYAEEMGTMVEDRMRRTILAVGSSWFTAWVDAGQPDLRRLLDKDFSPSEESLQEEIDQAYQTGEAKGREHGG